MKYQGRVSGHDVRRVARKQLGRDFAFGGIVGESRAMREVVEYARRVAERGFGSVLVVGESGTGKSLLARGLHYGSETADEPFVSVGCGKVPAHVLEVELFGHEPGVLDDGTGRRTKGLLELAGGGTVYLEDIESLAPALQPKLLRALEERRVRCVGGVEEYDVRCAFVMGASRPLEEDVMEGRFREDLFYRLNGLRISVPRLEERSEDIALLANHFVDEAVRTRGLGPVVLSDDAVSALEAHHWPGNVRELRTVVMQAVLVCGGGRILAQHLSIQDRRRYPLLTQPPVGAILIPPGGMALDDIEAEALRMTLELTEGNQSAAARVLGISRPTLLRKARKYGLEDQLRRRTPV